MPSFRQPQDRVVNIPEAFVCQCGASCHADSTSPRPGRLRVATPFPVRTHRHPRPGESNLQGVICKVAAIARTDVFSTAAGDYGRTPFAPVAAVSEDRPRSCRILMATRVPHFEGWTRQQRGGGAARCH